MRWGDIWLKQYEQQRAFNLDPIAMSQSKKIETAKDLLLGMNEEVVKLAKYATHYKAHILRQAAVETVNVADAVVDIIKYAIAIGQLHGLTDEDVYEAFLCKTDVVFDKARGERLIFNKKTPVLLFDLDNVIVDLTQWDKNISQAKNGKVEGMDDHMVDMLESMKTEFYRYGGFVKLAPIEGAKESIDILSGYGWKIVLISARPVWQYKRIHADTVRWLMTNEIKYDLLLFNKDKAEAVVENIFPAKPSYLVDDRGKHVIEVSDIGIKALLMSYPYNESVVETALIKRVKSWSEIVDTIGRPNGQI